MEPDTLNDDVNQKHIMLVEDDTELAALMQEYFTHNHFRVSIVQNGLDAVDAIFTNAPDLVILDIMLPGQSGLEVCKQIRQQYQGIILMQTALDDDVDQIMGLESGADDYIVKQVNPRLLLSRIHSLFRRVQRQTVPSIAKNAHNTATRMIHCGPLHISQTNRSVTLNGVFVELTTTEFDLLLLLAATPGHVVSRDDIVQQLRGFEYDGLDRSIDRQISRLRKKLSVHSTESELIKTIRGKGYQLCF
ncbi:response regulator transcription factor [Vibrio quintilis]|uniref:Transcriptional regulatory protein RstA n=1 Tax=Vibrio quintilis TaxID=1117707 RepID=A0A1M7YV60_9VIBR|nr:response regulator transcription factor [Vibrio quintilis]SHO56570.1 Transcriptional regulatory protein RstA [Vibrio quintilis]